MRDNNKQWTMIQSNYFDGTFGPRWHGCHWVSRFCCLFHTFSSWWYLCICSFQCFCCLKLFWQNLHDILRCEILRAHLHFSMTWCPSSVTLTSSSVFIPSLTHAQRKFFCSSAWQFSLDEQTNISLKYPLYIHTTSTPFMGNNIPNSPVRQLTNAN